MENTVELNSCHCWLSKMSHIQTTHLLHSNVAIQRLIIHLSPNLNYFKCESHPTSQRRPTANACVVRRKKSLLTKLPQLENTQEHEGKHSFLLLCLC